MPERKEYSKPEYNKLIFTCDMCNKLVLHESFSWEIATHSRMTQVISDPNLHDYQWNYISDHSRELGNKKPFIKNYINISYDSLYKKNISSIFFVTRICSECGGRTYWEVIHYLDNQSEQVTKILPIVSSIELETNSHMTEEQQKLFNEAKEIFDKSPKAAGALLRCILESVLREKYKEKHEKSFLGSILNDNAVKKDLGDEIISVCEACKLIGNKSAHSTLTINLDENKYDVILLFELVDWLVEKLISGPKNDKLKIQKCKEIISLIKK